MHEIMTRPEVATYLRVSQATVSRYAASGDLPPLPVRGRLLFHRDTVMEFARSLRVCNEL